MDVATTTLAERIARVLAGRQISANAGGHEESAAARIDATWQDHHEDALAVLKTLREPSRGMAAVGDVAIWERMVLAAIEETKPRAVVL
ncbi:MAG: hypothetical protein ACRYFW_02360 [Janthinobacterium lividum]